MKDLGRMFSHAMDESMSGRSHALYSENRNINKNQPIIYNIIYGFEFLPFSA